MPDLLTSYRRQPFRIRPRTRSRTHHRFLPSSFDMNSRRYDRPTDACIYHRSMDRAGSLSIVGTAVKRRGLSYLPFHHWRRKREPLRNFHIDYTMKRLGKGACCIKKKPVEYSSLRILAVPIEYGKQRPISRTTARVTQTRAHERGATQRAPAVVHRRRAVSRTQRPASPRP